MSTLELENVSKQFGAVTALEPLDLRIANGELVCLLGPSGSGKSTLLRIIGGFEMPTEGKVLIDDSDVARTPPEKRPTAMVFQSHALWGHMTVEGNIGFGLKLRGLRKQDIAAKVEAALKLVGLADYGKRHPAQLSGGQRQRVAIARCLVLEPKILLMDEPFASLDQHLRDRLREEVRQIQKKLGITTVFVTHGQDEALSIADRIVVMSMGRIEQVGTPAEIYTYPQTPFVAGFIGDMNMLKAVVTSGAAHIGDVQLDAPVPDGDALFAVRPEDVTLTPSPNGEGVRVRRIVNYGAVLKIEAEAPDGALWKVQTLKDVPVTEGGFYHPTVSRHIVFRDERAVHRVDPV